MSARRLDRLTRVGGDHVLLRLIAKQLHQAGPEIAREPAAVTGVVEDVGDVGVEADAGDVEEETPGDLAGVDRDARFRR